MGLPSVDQVGPATAPVVPARPGPEEVEIEQPRSRLSFRNREWLARCRKMNCGEAHRFSLSGIPSAHRSRDSTRPACDSLSRWVCGSYRSLALARLSSRPARRGWSGARSSMPAAPPTSPIAVARTRAWTMASNVSLSSNSIWVSCGPHVPLFPNSIAPNLQEHQRPFAQAAIQHAPPGRLSAPVVATPGGWRTNSLVSHGNFLVLLGKIHEIRPLPGDIVNVHYGSFPVIVGTTRWTAAFAVACLKAASLLSAKSGCLPTPPSGHGKPSVPSLRRTAFPSLAQPAPLDPHIGEPKQQDADQDDDGGHGGARRAHLLHRAAHQQPPAELHEHAEQRQDQ